MAAMLVTKSNQGKKSFFFSSASSQTIISQKIDIVYNSFWCQAQYQVLKRLINGHLLDFAKPFVFSPHMPITIEVVLTTRNTFYLLGDSFKKACNI